MTRPPAASTGWTAPAVVVYDHDTWTCLVPTCWAHGIRHDSATPARDAHEHYVTNHRKPR